MTDSARVKNRSAQKPQGGPWPFETDADVMAFAKMFLRERARGFKKDLDICLTARENNQNKRSHAYMPSLLLCFAFLDLLSGLYVGRIVRHGREDFLNYVKKFMPNGRYNEYDLRVLYVGFRHKIAHLSHPYLVLDTSKEKGIGGGAPKRIVWTIYASPRKKPIELIDCPTPKTISSHPTPWPVPYDFRIKISIATLATDARKSLRGRKGYIAALEESPQLQKNFRACMKSFFPR